MGDRYGDGRYGSGAAGGGYYREDEYESAGVRGRGYGHSGGYADDYYPGHDERDYYGEYGHHQDSYEVRDGYNGSQQHSQGGDSVTNQGSENVKSLELSSSSTAPTDVLGSSGNGGTNVKPAGSAKLKDGWRNMVANNIKKDLWKTVIIKATARDLNPPKQKHIESIMTGLNNGSGDVTDRNSATGSICHHLRKRLLERDWIVAAKALTVFHYILRECIDVNLIKQLSTSFRKVFDTSGFQNELPEGYAFVPFVRTYGAYLTKWCELKAKIDYPPTKVGPWLEKSESEFSETFAKTDPKVLIEALPMVSATLKVLYAVDIKGPIRNSPVGAPAIGLIARDFEHYWISLQQGYVTLIDAFFRVPESVAPRASKAAMKLYETYSAFGSEVTPAAKEYIALVSQVRPGWEGPKIEDPPEYAVHDILMALYEHAYPDSVQVAPIVDAGGALGGPSKSGYRGAVAQVGSNEFFNSEADPFAPLETKVSKKGSKLNRRGSAVPDEHGAGDTIDRLLPANDGFDSLLLAPPKNPAASVNAPHTSSRTLDASAWQGGDPFGEPQGRAMVPRQSGGVVNPNMGMMNPMQLQQQQLLLQQQQQQAMMARRMQMQKMQQMQQLQQMQQMQQQPYGGYGGMR
uniref:ENTH domain-containing protein n=1 Tax=Timspurckia oligopyrenoides TaxID=708627 RepID=A0A7S0ZKV8_9RHOD|mmetsp:Transcript_9263/g.16685  ORF Transcript_9263/g.16685 Transcript_9263/m.16685 type:complete len:630 (+) Transcript_9263:99-1988(+)